MAGAFGSFGCGVGSSKLLAVEVSTAEMTPAAPLEFAVVHGDPEPYRVIPPMPVVAATKSQFFRYFKRTGVRIDQPFSERQ